MTVFSPPCYNAHERTHGKETVSYTHLNLFSDKGFLNAAKNTLFMVFWSVLIQMVVGVAAALAIQRMRHFRGVVQALIVMPMVIPPVIAGLIWRILLIPKYGGIHALLYGLGIHDAPAWLTDPVSARWVIVLVAVDVYKRQAHVLPRF